MPFACFFLETLSLCAQVRLELLPPSPRQLAGTHGTLCSQGPSLNQCPGTEQFYKYVFLKKKGHPEGLPKDDLCRKKFSGRHNQFKGMKVTGKYFLRRKRKKVQGFGAPKRQSNWLRLTESAQDTLLGLIVFRTQGTLGHSPAVSSLASVTLCHNLGRKQQL